MQADFSIRGSFLHHHAPWHPSQYRGLKWIYYSIEYKITRQISDTCKYDAGFFNNNAEMN